MMLVAQGLSKAYGRTQVLSEVELRVGKGEWWGIIGPNGSGKSTLMQLLSGVERPSKGSVRLLDREIGSYSRKALARIVAVLQQEGLDPTDFTVREVLEMGRYPFLNWLGREEQDAAPLIDSIMEKLELRDIQERRLTELSGGQRQRVALGKVMVQEPSLLMLDEPTTYLDIHYQLQFMEMVDAWRQASEITVISVLHDLNLAAQFCDKLLVLHEGRVAGMGSPEEVLTEAYISRIFRVMPSVVKHPENGAPQVLLTANRTRK
ncbi:ABC transporter ATP-binding protein [Paenibacillus lactis]|uniref:Iron complex transport system ATP-binding protein n=2 Tax=Paenibacillus TaxID=44249 RepID=A0ABS4F7Y0_9BACL|nr:iron complex transport system ATP-binding protein [Paenibacillus lactis]GIO89796.1 ABC transporter ATP-binding protein [Paenibacillus lactis]